MSHGEYAFGALAIWSAPEICGIVHAMDFDPEIEGKDWTAAEQDLIVADYFDMLRTELAGGTVNKAARNRALQALTGRKRGSIEYKHMNVSEALKRIGLPTINGYKPYSNIQDSLVDAIDRYLSSRPDALIVDPASDGDRFYEAGRLFVEPAPDPINEVQPIRARMEALVRKFDPVERDLKNRKLGRAGEELIFSFEKHRLREAGCQELAEMVRWVSDEEGDGHGYDIESYSVTGQKRLIEVKTTTGDQRTPFFLSRNEERVSRERDEFRLYRLYDFLRTPRLFKLNPPLDAKVVLETEVWRASFS